MTAKIRLIVEWECLVLLFGAYPPFWRVETTTRQCERLYAITVIIPVDGAGADDGQYAGLRFGVIAPLNILDGRPCVANRILAKCAAQLRGRGCRKLHLLLQAFDPALDGCIGKACGLVEASARIDFEQRDLIGSRSRRPTQLLKTASLDGQGNVFPDKPPLPINTALSSEEREALTEVLDLMDRAASCTGRNVTDEELITSAWPMRIGEQANSALSIMMVRGKLSDDVEAPTA